ncbi:MAG: S8 family serine peptidase [Deltaproteobacteria bacterium]|nr:S8 family serine peptidase [Deltaproteobacteria bacterium]
MAATDQHDDLASFSNFGPTSVHVAAPGQNVTTTQLWGGVTQSFSGTSAAAPVVAGVAALVKARFPGKSVGKLKSAILGNVDARSSLIGKVASGGRVNAQLAVRGGPDGVPSVAATSTGNRAKRSSTISSRQFRGRSVRRRWGRTCA